MVCNVGGLPLSPAIEDTLMIRPPPWGIIELFATCCDSRK